MNDVFRGGRQLVVSALDFGFKVDGSPAHNSYCLQSAINQAVSVGSKYVYVHPGVYKMDDDIIVNLKGVRIIGDSASVTGTSKVYIFDIWNQALDGSDQVLRDLADIQGEIDYLNRQMTKVNQTVSNLRTTVSNISQSSDTNTTDISSLKQRMNTAEGDITNLKQSVASGKTAIAGAITAKGVATANDATFATMATNINLIPSGSGTYTDAELAPVTYSRTFIGSNDAGTLPMIFDGAFLTVDSSWYAFWQKVSGSTWTLVNQYSGSGTLDGYVFYVKDKNGVTADVFNYNISGRGTSWTLNTSYQTAIRSVFVDYNKKTITVTAFQSNGGSGDNYYAAKGLPAEFDMKSMQLCFYVKKGSPKGKGDVGLTVQGRGVQTIT